MIRQLGPPTFFVTFTCSEQHWEDLQITLKTLSTDKKFTKNSSYNVQTLVRDDPVTCARYYAHRTRCLRQLLKQSSHTFGKLTDYYFVTELQSRGSEHDHALLWIKDAPLYNENNKTDIISFVENHISCDKNLLEKDLEKMQIHHHTRTCKKKTRSNCRFHYPQPPNEKNRHFNTTNSTY